MRNTLTKDKSTDSIEIHVGPGKEAFPTLEAARDHLRQVRSCGPLPQQTRVVVEPATLALSQSFTLSCRDAGTAESPIVYSAGKTGQVRLLGGRRLEAFAPVYDPAILARLPIEARKHVMQTDLRALGIEHLGSLSPRGFSRPITPGI